MPQPTVAVADALRDVLVNESDANGEAANVVDAIAQAGRDVRFGLETVARQLGRLADTLQRKDTTP